MLTSAITTEALARVLEAFLIETPQAVLIENGEVLFNFATARYSVSGEGKCVLHVWSEARNIVRRVLDAERRPNWLRLSVLRFGQSQPELLEIGSDGSHRSAASQRAARVQFQRLLIRMLEREYPSAKIESISSKADLEHSFSPVYTRAVLRSGQSAFAVLGVNAEEVQAAIDASLTFGILWMDHQRQQLAGRSHIEGLKLFVPYGQGEIVRQRIAHLDRHAAKWQLYEMNDRAESCDELDDRDHGNLATRLERAVDESAVRERFANCLLAAQPHTGKHLLSNGASVLGIHVDFAVEQRCPEYLRAAELLPMNCAQTRRAHQLRHQLAEDDGFGECL